MKAKKLILAGDPKQLPPTVLSSPAPGGPVSLDQHPPASKVNTPTGTSGNQVPLQQSPGSDDSENEPGPENSSGTMIEADNLPTAREYRSETVQNFCHHGLTPPRTLEATMFERLVTMYGPAIKRMLTVQYRYVEVHATRAAFIIAIGQDAHKDS